MRSRRLSDVKTLLESEPLQSWWRELTQARQRLSDCEAERDQLLSQLALSEFKSELTQKNAIDTLYQSGSLEDEAAALLAESETLENRGFPGVAAFEEQRFKVSEIWYRLGAAETSLEQAREDKRDQSEILALEKKLIAVRSEYERELQRKKKLWEDVETLWDRSTEVSLLRAERQALALKVRRNAEKRFAEAEEAKAVLISLRERSKALSKIVEEANARVDEIHRQAAVLFKCLAGNDFLYFRHPTDSRHAFAVSLVNDLESYNVEVRPLVVYSVDRRRGVGFLEPAREATPSDDEGDRRFEAYFLTGRLGQTQDKPQ